jgi:hypothetical protein
MRDAGRTAQFIEFTKALRTRFPSPSAETYSIEVPGIVPTDIVTPWFVQLVPFL